MWFRTLMLSLALGASEMAWGQAADADGQAPPPPATSTVEGSEYGGIVTSQVLTSLGHYFHGKFTEGWNTYPDAQSYVLLVKEFFSPRFGTEIRVIFNDRLVYRSVLPRNFVAVAELSKSAVETVHDNLVELGLQNALFNDPDMAKSGY